VVRIVQGLTNDGRPAELARAKVRNLEQLAAKVAGRAARRWAALQQAALSPA